MADLRALSAVEVTALTNDTDNGGSIIATGGIKLIHQFNEPVDVAYFGAILDRTKLAGFEFTNHYSSITGYWKLGVGYW